MKENDDLKNKTLSALFFSFGGLIINSASVLLLNIILARLLIPADYGLLGMIMIFINISQMFVDSGMTSALIREKESSEEDYSTVFYYNLVLAAIMYIMLFMSANMISRFFNEPRLVAILKIVGLNLIISSFGLIQRTILIKNLDFKTQLKVEVFSVVLSGIVAIYMAYSGHGVWSLVIQLLLKQLVTSVMFSIHNRWRPLLKFSMSSFRRLFGFGWRMLLTGVLGTIYNNIYNLVIGKSYTSEQLGYYTKGLQTRDLAAASITSTLEKVSFPVLSKLQDDPERFKNNFKKIIRNASFITFPIMIGMLVVANIFVGVLFGEAWISMVPYLQILCLGGVTFPHRAINLNVLKVVGRSDLFLKIDMLKMLIGSVLIGLVIVLDLGIYGLLWTTFISAKIAFVANSFFSKRYISYSTKEQFIDMIPTMVASLLMGVVVYTCGNIMPFQNMISLIVQIIIGVITYIAFSKLLKIEELDEGFKLIKPVIIKLKDKLNLVKKVKRN